jgi:DNA polymerase delta subunit 2
MPVKPNILEELAVDLSMPVPPPPKKIYSPEDVVYLEDESGRIKLCGEALKTVALVTGVIIGVIGHENDNSEFEVLALEFCGMPPQSDQNRVDDMDVDGGESVARALNHRES